MIAPSDIPPMEAFMWPIIERLKAHGRSLSNAEMLQDVAQHMALSEEAMSVRHGKWNQLVVDQRLGLSLIHI